MSSQTRDTSPREPGAFCTERQAFRLGIVASILIGVPTFMMAVGYVWQTIGQMFLLLLALWPSLMTVQFWASGSWRNGMTKREIMYLIGVPADIVRTVRFGKRALMDQVTGKEIRSYDDEGEKLLSERQSIMTGVALFVISGLLLFFGLRSALTVGGSVLALAVVLWVFACITYYWVSEAYKGGLTKAELVRTLLGPVSVFRLVREAAKKFAIVRAQRGTSQTDTSQTGVL